MLCPNCNSELKIDDAVYLNVDIYDKPAMVVTNCCNSAVTVTRRTGYSITPYNGPRTEDDWGNPIPKEITLGQILEKYCTDNNIPFVDLKIGNIENFEWYGIPVLNGDINSKK